MVKNTKYICNLEKTITTNKTNKKLLTQVLNIDNKHIVSPMQLLLKTQA